MLWQMFGLAIMLILAIASATVGWRLVYRMNFGGFWQSFWVVVGSILFPVGVCVIFMLIIPTYAHHKLRRAVGLDDYAVNRPIPFKLDPTSHEVTWPVNDIPGSALWVSISVRDVPDGPVKDTYITDPGAGKMAVPDSTKQITAWYATPTGSSGTTVSP